MPEDEDEELVIYISPDSTRAAWAYIGFPFFGSFMGRFPLQTREEDTIHMVFVQANQWLSAISAREQSRGGTAFTEGFNHAAYAPLSIDSAVRLTPQRCLRELRAYCASTVIYGLRGGSFGLLQTRSFRGGQS